MRKTSKRALYESIMKNVAKLVKETLNESSVNLSDISNKLNNLCKDVFRPLVINANISSFTYETGKFGSIKKKDDSNAFTADPKLIINCAGYIIEQYVNHIFKTEIFSNEEKITPIYHGDDNKIHHDFSVITSDGEEYKFEVKALLNGTSNNINLTTAQKENGKDYIFIFVNYKINGNNIIINSFNIVPGNNAPVEDFINALKRLQTKENSDNNRDFSTIFKKCSNYLNRNTDISDKEIGNAISKYISSHSSLFTDEYGDTIEDFDTLCAENRGKRNVVDVICRSLKKLFNNDSDEIYKFINDANNVGNGTYINRFK